MEDPIFDPWSLGEESRPSTPSASSTSGRWSTTAADGPLRPIPPVPAPSELGGPAPRQVWFIDDPLDEISRSELIAAASPKRPTEGGLTPSELEADEPSQDEPEAALEPMPELSPMEYTPELSVIEPAPKPPVLEPTMERSDEPAPADSDDILQVVVRPRFRDLYRRAILWGHHVLIDDRLDGERPRIRLRLEPRRGPLDDPSDSSASAIEVVWEDRTVMARFWQDALARDPSEVRSVQPERLTAGWMDAVVMDFVQSALDPGSR